MAVRTDSPMKMLIALSINQTKSKCPLVTTVQITAINGLKQHRERP